MSNGTPTPAPPPNGDPALPALASTGIKLLSEAVIPGGSLLLEKNVSGGVGAAAVGILGGAAMGAVFGPIGYLVTRVGTSVVSYASAIGKPVPVITPPDLGPVVTGLNETNRSIHQLHADLAPIMTQLATERARFAPAAAVQAPADTVTRAELNEAVHQILAEIKNLPHKRGTSS